MTCSRDEMFPTAQALWDTEGKSIHLTGLNADPGVSLQYMRTRELEREAQQLENTAWYHYHLGHVSEHDRLMEIVGRLRTHYQFMDRQMRI